MDPTLIVIGLIGAAVVLIGFTFWALRGIDGDQSPSADLSSASLDESSKIPPEPNNFPAPQQRSFSSGGVPTGYRRGLQAYAPTGGGSTFTLSLPQAPYLEDVLANTIVLI